VGTQLAYGGSGSAPWEDAADYVADLDAAVPAGGDSIGTVSSDVIDGADTAAGFDANIDSLIDHVIEAIEAHERRPIPGAITNFAPASVRPSSYISGGRSVSSGTSKFVSTPRSGRSAKQAIARGAAAVAAGSALARGDAGALRDLGLDLERLRAFSPREQQQLILDEIIGAPGHPDDEALRRAAHATLKAIVADPDMAQDAQIDHLLGSYVYEQALVELTSQHANRALSRDAVTKLEKRLKPYIFKKAKHVVTGSRRYLSPTLFIEKAASLAEKVFKAMRSYR
jgi:hypothetical protein